MSDHSRSNLAADKPLAKQGADDRQKTNEQISEKLSLAGNIREGKTRSKTGNSLDKTFLLADGSGTTTQVLPDDSNATSAAVATPTDASGATSPVIPTDASDTTSTAKPAKFLQGEIKHDEDMKTGEAATGDQLTGQVDDREVPKPITFYSQHGRIDNSIIRQFDDKFLYKVMGKLNVKVDDLLNSTLGRQFPIPQGSSISISCILDKNAHVSQLKVESSSRCEKYNQLLLQSVREVDGDPDLRLPADFPDYARKENSDFDVDSLQQTRRRTAVEISGCSSSTSVPLPTK